jgi:hypothetical protein
MPAYQRRRRAAPPQEIEHTLKHIDDQILLIERTKAEGGDTESAERVLETYRQILRLLADQ